MDREKGVEVSDFFTRIGNRIDLLFKGSQAGNKSQDAAYLADSYSNRVELITQHNVLNADLLLLTSIDTLNNCPVLLSPVGSDASVGRRVVSEYKDGWIMFYAADKGLLSVTRVSH